MEATLSNLLVELFVEELPPKSLRLLGQSFASALAASLARQGLTDANPEFKAFASPRRLAVHVVGVSAQAAAVAQQHKLVPVTVGLDGAGQATPALLKKLAVLGRDASALPRLQQRREGKALTLFLEHTAPGVLLQAGLQSALDEALRQLPIPKVMSYQLADGWSQVSFVRPAHGLVALHGAQVVPVQALGLVAGRVTQGHRFESSRAEISLQHADSYAQQLADEGAVLANFDQRRSELERRLAAAAQALGLTPVQDEALLDEVTALVERPTVFACQFDPAFLGVPPECLVLTMKANQKYFPLLDDQGRLTHCFLVVSNIRPADASLVIAGNERVVRPRLADAKFFFDQDRKKRLEERLAGLDRVVYHNQLGSQGQRMARVRSIAANIGQRLGGAALAAAAQRAATLAKADLLTDMVGEFPELQGVMGGYYARHDGEHEDVAFAIEDHYKPRFAGDALARNNVGLVLALADKLETLAGLFGIGQAPSGDKDPFALRRHALGVLRMLMERSVPLALRDLIDLAFAAFSPGMLQSAQPLLQAFMQDRLSGLLRERGYSNAEVEAVLSSRPERLGQVTARLDAVRSFAALPQAAALAAANKRIGNILKKSAAVAFSGVSAALLREPAERALHSALERVGPLAQRLFDQEQWAASLGELAQLRAPVDAFFEQVMVNTDDADLRDNRLSLLTELHRAMNRVADLSRLAA